MGKAQPGTARKAEGIQGGQGGAKQADHGPRRDNTGIRGGNAIPMGKA